MRVVGIRELKNRLSQYIRMVRGGEEIVVTDRGEIVAELRKPGRSWDDIPYPALQELARRGGARLGAPNRPDLYPALPRLVADGEVERLLESERGER